jgi:hypothetical protein
MTTKANHIALGVGMLGVAAAPVLVARPHEVSAQDRERPRCEYLERDDRAIAPNFSTPRTQTIVDTVHFDHFEPGVRVRVRVFGLLRVAGAPTDADSWIDLSSDVNGEHIDLFVGNRMSGQPGPRTFDHTFEVRVAEDGTITMPLLIGQCSGGNHNPQCGIEGGHVEISVVR